MRLENQQEHATPVAAESPAEREERLLQSALDRLQDRVCLVRVKFTPVLGQDVPPGPPTTQAGAPSAPLIVFLEEVRRRVDEASEQLEALAGRCVL